jgi:hypothetical protein
MPSKWQQETGWRRPLGVDVRCGLAGASLNLLPFFPLLSHRAGVNHKNPKRVLPLASTAHWWEIVMMPSSDGDWLFVAQGLHGIYA